jgi:hypothetical protein
MWLFQQVLPVPVLMVPWLVVLVGLHFFFFASAFSIPIIERMGAVLMATGIVGDAVVLQFANPSASGLTGVVAGFILLEFSAATAQPARARLRPDRHRHTLTAEAEEPPWIRTMLSRWRTSSQCGMCRTNIPTP